jgi:hypothetical protein
VLENAQAVCIVVCWGQLQVDYSQNALSAGVHMQAAGGLGS